MAPKSIHVTRVFYKPNLKNNFTWKVRELATTDKDSGSTVEIHKAILTRKEAKLQRHSPVKRLVKRNGFLGTNKNRGKLMKMEAKCKRETKSI